MGFTIQGSTTLSTQEQQGRNSRKTRSAFLSFLCQREKFPPFYVSIIFHLNSV